MEIAFIKKKEIVEFARNAPETFVFDVPITLPRAVSQAANPDAADEDVLLIIAKQGDKLLSYIGLYPSRIQNDAARRIFWISCWWKAPKVSSGISRKVLDAFLEYTGEEAGVPHLPPHIIRVLKEKGIFIRERDGFMLRFRSAIHKRSLQRSLKGRAHRLIFMLRKSGFFKITDIIINRTKPEGKLINGSSLNPDFQILFELPGEDYFTFIHSRTRNYLSLPHEKNIEWILAFPWLVSPKDADKDILKRYHFSYVAESFYHFFPVLRKEGKIVAAGFFSSRDGAVKSLYLFVDKGFEEEYFKSILLFLESDKSFHTLISYEKNLVEFLGRLKNKRLQPLSIKRYMGVRKKEYNSLEPADADGDSCFT